MNTRPAIIIAIDVDCEQYMNGKSYFPVFHFPVRKTADRKMKDRKIET